MDRVLTFDEATHIYRVNGRRVPGVTDILRKTGVSKDFEKLAALSDEKRRQITAKRDVGIAVHADTHAYDDNDLVERGVDGTEWPTVDPRVLPALKAWVTFRQNSGLTPLKRERRLFHPYLFYCGTLDGVFWRDQTHRRILVDTKMGNPKDAAAQFQTAAYQLAWEYEHPDDPIHERWSVWLKPDNIVPYEVIPYTDANDFNDWVSILRTYNLQAARREERDVAA